MLILLYVVIGLGAVLTPVCDLISKPKYADALNVKDKISMFGGSFETLREYLGNFGLSSWEEVSRQLMAVDRITPLVRSNYGLLQLRHAQLKYNLDVMLQARSSNDRSMLLELSQLNSRIWLEVGRQTVALDQLEGSQKVLVKLIFTENADLALRLSFIDRLNGLDPSRYSYFRILGHLLVQEQMALALFKLVSKSTLIPLLQVLDQLIPALHRHLVARGFYLSRVLTPAETARVCKAILAEVYDFFLGRRVVELSPISKQFILAHGSLIRGLMKDGEAIIANLNKSETQIRLQKKRVVRIARAVDYAIAEAHDSEEEDCVWEGPQEEVEGKAITNQDILMAAQWCRQIVIAPLVSSMTAFSYAQLKNDFPRQPKLAKCIQVIEMRHKLAHPVELPHPADASKWKCPIIAGQLLAEDWQAADRLTALFRLASWCKLQEAYLEGDAMEAECKRVRSIRNRLAHPHFLDEARALAILESFK